MTRGRTCCRASSSASASSCPPTPDRCHIGSVAIATTCTPRSTRAPRQRSGDAAVGFRDERATHRRARPAAPSATSWPAAELAREELQRTAPIGFRGLAHQHQRHHDARAAPAHDLQPRIVPVGKAAAAAAAQHRRARRERPVAHGRDSATAAARPRRTTNQITTANTAAAAQPSSRRAAASCRGSTPAPSAPGASSGSPCSRSVSGCSHSGCCRARPAATARCGRGSRSGRACGRRPARRRSSRRRRRPAGGGAHHLPVLEHVALPVEAVGRPRERRQLRQLPHVLDVEADVHEAAAVAARQADARRPRHPGPRTARARRSRSTRARGSTSRSAPRSATSAATDALTLSVAEPSSAQVQLLLVLVLAACSTPPHADERTQAGSQQTQRRGCAPAREGHETSMIS